MRLLRVQLPRRRLREQPQVLVQEQGRVLEQWMAAAPETWQGGAWLHQTAGDPREQVRLVEEVVVVAVARMKALLRQLLLLLM